METEKLNREQKFMHDLVVRTIDWGIENGYLQSRSQLIFAPSVNKSDSWMLGFATPTNQLQNYTEIPLSYKMLKIWGTTNKYASGIEERIFPQLMSGVYIAFFSQLDYYVSQVTHEHITFDKLCKRVNREQPAKLNIDGRSMRKDALYIIQQYEALKKNKDLSDLTANRQMVVEALALGVFLDENPELELPIKKLMSKYDPAQLHMFRAYAVLADDKKETINQQNLDKVFLYTAQQPEIHYAVTDTNTDGFAELDLRR